LNERKQAKVHWFENTSHTNEDNMNTGRYEIHRTFGEGGTREYLKEK